MTAAAEGEGGAAPAARTPGGTAWRAAVLLVLAVGLIAGGSALGSELVGHDVRLGMVAAVPAAVCVGVPTMLWLRARQGHIAAPLLGTLLAVLSGANLLHDHRSVYAGHALHLIRTGSAVYEESLLAAGAVVALAAVLVAAVDGHRHPRAD
ncbi:hypothetical protein [Streptomyces sp. NPDC020983]|uniref:hypothetical protein n=1 Tax=Streptomyces sp. NPDC020983 TaxID=3365106 RepID=UPI0037B825BE